MCDWCRFCFCGGHHSEESRVRLLDLIDFESCMESPLEERLDTDALRDVEAETVGLDTDEENAYTSGLIYASLV